MPSFNKDPAVTAVKKLIASKHLNTQKELCLAMQEMGFNINQSKISRILRKINATKCKDVVGNIVYHLPKELTPPPTNTLVTNLILKLNYNDYLLVITTCPGSAQLIARIIEHQKHRLEILGCIAGNDTIFVTFNQNIKPQDYITHIEQLLLIA